MSRLQREEQLRFREETGLAARVPVAADSLPQQDAYTSAFQIGCDNVEFAVTVYVGNREPPNSSAGRKRRARRWLEVAAAIANIAKHDPHALASRGKRINTSVAVHVREDHLKGITAKVERRAACFRKMARTIAEQDSQLALLVMSGHQIRFAIAIHIADVSEPGLTGAQRKLASAKATMSVIQQQR
jgi:hypothetical protein